MGEHVIKPLMMLIKREYRYPIKVILKLWKFIVSEIEFEGMISSWSGDE